MDYVLGIDIGTGSAKAVAVNLVSEPITVAQLHYPTYSPHPGFSEQDPELIWEAVKGCVKEIVDKLKSSPLAICFSSAMHSIIPVNEKGSQLTDMITWADCRSDAIASRLKNSTQGIHIYESSGMPLHAMSPLCKIIWLKENMPDVFNQTYKFISIKEYIWFKLFDEYVIDHSIACASGMLDISSRTWSQELLGLAGISENQLSKPVSTTYIATGAHSLQGILNKETIFVIGASDGCLANLGSFAIRKGVAAVTIGTSGAVRIASDKPIFNKEAMTFSYCLDENTFICGGPVNNGGNVLQWLITSFLAKTVNKQNIEEVFALAETVSPGADGLLFLPYINGERAPVWDAKSSGAFVGIRSVHTQANFSRAVLEGICYALNDVLIAVETGSENISQVNVSGGFVNSQTWMQLLADITGKRLALLQTEDASAKGAAFMAIKALGLNDGKYPADIQNDRSIFIEPDPEKHKLYKRNFQVFKRLYSGLKDSMHQLNLINS
ncbi:gluconokinase [Daejeonella sp.]|uniref:gluconokinase n=1 Tax=Daejeonella sp. TaxID=2805397 RepID=UPI0030BEFE35